MLPFFYLPAIESLRVSTDAPFASASTVQKLKEQLATDKVTASAFRRKANVTALVVLAAALAASVAISVWLWKRRDKLFGGLFG